MHKITKIIFILIILAVYITPLNAQNNIWIGGGLSIDYDKLDTETIQFYPRSTYYLAEEDLKSINRVGPSLELSYFLPFFKYISINLESRILFPVGVSGFPLNTISRNADYSAKIMAGISGNIPLYENYGLFLSIFSDNTFNRIATTNIKNDKGIVEYNEYNTYGLAGSFGVYANNNDKYFFKLSATYAHSLTSNQYNINMTLSGGFIL